MGTRSWRPETLAALQGAYVAMETRHVHADRLADEQGEPGSLKIELFCTFPPEPSG